MPKQRITRRMRALCIAFLAVLCCLPVDAQSLIAEGEYQSHGISASGAASVKSVTRWVLYDKNSKSYDLRSETLSLPGGIRVFHNEELDARFVRTAIGVELFRKGEKKPRITLKCQFSGAAITCRGESEKGQAKASEPYPYNGPFFFMIGDFAMLNLPCLFAGTVNMAHLETGKAMVPTITVWGGTATMLIDTVNMAYLESVKSPGTTLTAPGALQQTEWDFSSDDEEPQALEFVGVETVEIDGTKVTSNRYRYGSGRTPTNLWIAAPGLPIKVSGDDFDLVLANYKQYKKLIPELPVEPQQATPASQKPE